jgi:hypothetical protein
MNVGQYGQTQMPMNGQASYANGNAADYQHNMPLNGAQDMHGNGNQVTEQKITNGDGEAEVDKDGKPRKEHDDDESDPQFEPEGGEGEEENKHDGDGAHLNNAPDGNHDQLGNIK